MKIYCRMETGLGKRTVEDRILVGDSILAGGTYYAEQDILATPIYSGP